MMMMMMMMMMMSVAQSVRHAAEQSQRGRQRSNATASIS